MFSLHEIYDLGIRIEKNGELFYRKAIKEFPNEGLKSLLARLADDEVKHQEFFARKKEALMDKPEHILKKLNSYFDYNTGRIECLKQTEITTVPKIYRF